MQIQDIVLIISLAINLVMLVLFTVQTRYLAQQTNSLSKSLIYTSYQKLVDYLNDVNVLLLENEDVAEIFRSMDFIQRSLTRNKNMSLEKIALAWLIINRYEAAFVGHQLGAIPKEEWNVWEKRLQKDLKIPFIRDVWVHDISNFDYNREFKELLNDML